MSSHRTEPLNRLPSPTGMPRFPHRCAGLPGHSIRELQRLVIEGSSLADLDWLTHDCYGYLPASHYVNEDGSMTASGNAKRAKPVRRSARNDPADAFARLHASDIAELASRHRHGVQDERTARPPGQRHA